MNRNDCVGLCGGITLALSEKGFDFVRFGLVIWKRGESEPRFVGSNETDIEALAAMFNIAKETVAGSEGDYFPLDDECEGHA